MPSTHARPANLCGAVVQASGAQADSRMKEQKRSMSHMDSSVPSETPRTITTIDDVAQVHQRGRASFEEWLDCVHVARAESRWDLVEDCALRALRAVGRRPLSPRTLEEAALAIVQSRLRQAEDLDALQSVASEALAALQQASQAVAANALEAIVKQQARLARLLLLLADDQPASYVSLCAVLRRFGRPDLGHAAATKALAVDPNNAQALTTRGAAAVDREDAKAARADLEQAWKLEPSPYVANALSRAFLALGLDRKAIEWANCSIDMDPDSPAAWHTLAAASLAAQELDLLERAKHRLSRYEADEQLDLFEGTSRRWVEVLAARELVRAGRIEEAQQTIQAILREGPYRPAEELRRDIALVRRTSRRER